MWEFFSPRMFFKCQIKTTDADNDDEERERDGALSARNKRKRSFMPLWRTLYMQKCMHGTSQLDYRVWTKWV